MQPQRELLEKMLQDGVEAVLVKTACPPGLLPSRHLKQTLGKLYYTGLFRKLHEKYKFHYCGEGGEYESLVIDCPIYLKRLCIDESEIVGSDDDGVGELVIKKCHSEKKDKKPEFHSLKTSSGASNSASFENLHSAKEEHGPCRKSCHLPHIKRVPGGLIHFSEILSQTTIHSSPEEQEGDLAVKEALEIFEALRFGLLQYGCNSQDVVFVHLYLSEISHFSNINKHYKSFFGTLLPPSRSCVAVGPNLPGGRRVLLDCVVQIGSGAFMRKSREGGKYTKAAMCNNNTSLREVLHVQSISHWAPVCVGPYSQVNTLRSGIHFIAGQIGLDPPTMTLKEGWVEQLKQCWTNLARILDALDGGSLQNLVSCLLYVSPEVIDWNLAHTICSDMVWKTNGNVIPGSVDSLISSTEMFDGYEDEGTWREMTAQQSGKKSGIPFLVVAIPELPVGSLVEIEAIAATERAASTLGKRKCLLEESFDSPNDIKNTKFSDFDTGHDFPIESELQISSFDCYATTVSIGSGCAAMCTVVASSTDIDNFLIFNPETLLSKMFCVAHSSLENASLSTKDALHVRLYYVVSGDEETAKNDGIRWRSSLATTLARETSLLFNKDTTVPAMSTIPVLRMKFWDDNFFTSPLVSLQVMTIDPVHLETELWINQCRD